MALLPSHYVDCVVALGNQQVGGSAAWVGSGFQYGYWVGVDSEGLSTYRTYVVTNRHVYTLLEHPVVRFNPVGSAPAVEVPAPLLDENGESLWYAHPDPDVDVVVFPLVFDNLKAMGVPAVFFASDNHAATTGKIAELGISEGDAVFVLGFPLGLVGQQRNSVAVRGGCISRIRDALAGADKSFWVDALVFPGNSGGPVVTRPEALAITGTKSQSASYLIGIVSGYVPYQDVAVSQQTHRPRIIFEENSGLVNVFTADVIDETIAVHLAKFPSVGVPVALPGPEADAPTKQ